MGRNDHILPTTVFAVLWFLVSAGMLVYIAGWAFLGWPQDHILYWVILAMLVVIASAGLVDYIS